MSGLSRKELNEVKALQEQYLARGGKIHRMPIHAPSTGAMRFNYSRRDYKERQEAKAQEAMEAERQKWAADPAGTSTIPGEIGGPRVA